MVRTSSLTQAQYQILQEAKEPSFDREAKIDELTKSVANYKANITDLRDMRNQMKAILAERHIEIEKQIEDHVEKAEKFTQQYVELTKPEDDGPKGSGPQHLSWCMGDRFNAVATLVIVVNLVFMVLEILDKNYKIEFFWYDQSFMVFYVFELTAKALYLQRGLLCGKLSFVWWNWLDGLIVITGVLDMWISPLIVALSSGDNSGGGGALSAMRSLRALRLLRIIKIIGMFLKSDLSWSAGPKFQLFIMGVIGFNAVLMGFESDIPDFWLWYYVEQLLLVIFTFEVACRVKLQGLRFFVHPQDVGWNNLDFLIVAGGVLDQWMMPAMDIVKIMLGMPVTGKSNLGQFMMMLRLARLLRILRLVRLIKSIPPLYTLVVGIVQAMQGMIWVMVLTIVTLYAIGLLCVKLVGHGLVFGGEAPEEIQEIFPTVTEACFVLFKSMNGDWGALEPLFAAMKVTEAFFMAYMVVSSWAILSILMAVVSENLLTATENHRVEEQRFDLKQREERSVVKLKELFRRADRGSNDGALVKEEFEVLVKDKFISFELLNAADLDDDDAKSQEATLKSLFDFLSSTPVGETQPKVTQERFIEGLKDESKPVLEKSVMRLQKRLLTLEKVIRRATKAHKAALGSGPTDGADNGASYSVRTASAR